MNTSVNPSPALLQLLVAGPKGRCKFKSGAVAVAGCSISKFLWEAGPTRGPLASHWEAGPKLLKER